MGVKEQTGRHAAILIMTLDGFPNCKFTVLLNVNSARYAAWKFIIRIAGRYELILLKKDFFEPFRWVDSDRCPRLSENNAFCLKEYSFYFNALWFLLKLN